MIDLTAKNKKFKSLNKIEIMKVSDDDTVEETLTQYYGADDSLLDWTDLNEYGWNFYVEKLRNNNREALNYLNTYAKSGSSNSTDTWSGIGTKLTDINKVRKTFVPTTSDQLSQDNISYFGTVTVSNQTVLMVFIPEGFNKAYIYEDESESANFEITVTDNSENGATDIELNNIVWIVITTGDSSNIGDINLSYICWTTNNNPNRNVHNFLVREDENNNFPVCTNTEGEHWLDMASGTIVGTTTVDEHPLLDLKEGRITQGEWNRNTSYAAGAEVTYCGDTYESLIPGNQGNHPILSTAWEISSSLDSNIKKGMVYITYQGSVVGNLGSITPSIVTVRDDADSISFTVTIDSGYMIGHEFFLDSSGDLLSGIEMTGNYGGTINTSNYTDYSDFLVRENKFELEEYKGNECLESILITYPLTSDLVDSGYILYLPIETPSERAELGNEITYQYLTSYISVSSDSDIISTEVLEIDGSEVSRSAEEYPQIDYIPSTYLVKVSSGESTLTVGSIDLQYLDLITGDSIETVTLDSSSVEDVTGGEITARHSLLYPVHYYFIYNMVEAFFTAYLLDYTNFHVDKTEVSISDGDISIIKCSPRYLDFTSSFTVEASTNGTTWLTMTGTGNLELSNGTVIIVSRTSESVNYYTLSIGGTINSDIYLKIWR